MKTLAELEALTDDELRVMLAELVGIPTKCFRFNYIGHDQRVMQRNRIINRSDAEREHENHAKWPGTTPIEEYLELCYIPNYSGDLNACQIVATALRGLDTFNFTKFIKVQVVDNAFELITATPRQRTIALILTLQKP